MVLFCSYIKVLYSFRARNSFSLLLILLEPGEMWRQPRQWASSDADAARDVRDVKVKSIFFMS